MYRSSGPAFRSRPQSAPHRRYFKAQSPKSPEPDECRRIKTDHRIAFIRLPPDPVSCPKLRAAIRETVVPTSLIRIETYAPSFIRSLPVYNHLRTAGPREDIPSLQPRPEQFRAPPSSDDGSRSARLFSAPAVAPQSIRPAHGETATARSKDISPTIAYSTYRREIGTAPSDYRRTQQPDTTPKERLPPPEIRRPFRMRSGRHPSSRTYRTAALRSTIPNDKPPYESRSEYRRYRYRNFSKKERTLCPSSSPHRSGYFRPFRKTMRPPSRYDVLILHSARLPHHLHTTRGQESVRIRFVFSPSPRRSPTSRLRHRTPAPAFPLSIVLPPRSAHPVSLRIQDRAPEIPLPLPLHKTAMTCPAHRHSRHRLQGSPPQPSVPTARTPIVPLESEVQDRTEKHSDSNGNRHAESA